MTPEMFQRARTVFLAAKRVDAMARRGLVEDICDGDEQLRALVDRLLEADEDSRDPMLDEPVLKHPLASSIDEFATPRQIGPYRVIRALGSGSVGDVYLAERDVAGERPVAIKVLRVGSVARGGLAAARFEVERAALSRLSHANIARIFDAGCTDSGRAFLVMEYVRGVRIDEYCRTHRLSRRSRLTLFLQLCDAVQHAHQRGVIHRDLKPANVLVVDEPWPTVKVVDFGIAKIVDDPSGVARSLTQDGQVLGTLAYMSPEQLDPSRGEPDARSDVYALGVMLYALLTDRMPFSDEDAIALRARAALNLTSVAPMKELSGAARRDLEMIVSKALHPDPERRYATPAHLGEDVRRHLSGNPVHARGPSTWYRLSKVASRHPTLVTVVSVFVIASTLLVMANALWRVEVERERRVARESVLSLMGATVEQMRHMSGLADTRHDMARALIAQTDRLLQFRPSDVELLECKARLLDELGDLLLREGDLAGAAEHRRQALDILRFTSNRAPPTLDRRRRLAEAIVKTGDLLPASSPERLALYERAMEMQLALEREFPTNAGAIDDLCWSYDRLSHLLSALGREERAAAYRERRMAMSLRLLSVAPDRPLSHHNAAWAHSMMADTTKDDRTLLDSTAIALAHAREAISHEPDRTAFQQTLVSMLDRRLHAVLNTTPGYDATLLLKDLLSESDRLRSTNPGDRELARMPARARAGVIPLLLRACEFDRAEELARDLLTMECVSAASHSAESRESPACVAVRALDRVAAATGRARVVDAPSPPLIASGDAIGARRR